MSKAAQHPSSEYIIAAFSAASWLPQNKKFFRPSLWKAFHKLGRKNYLFAGSHESAQRGAVIYSLLATCQIRGVEPFTWLKNALDTIPDYPANQLEKLLPAK